MATRYRILTYHGTDDWIENTLANSYVTPTGCRAFNAGGKISSVTFGAATSWALGLWLSIALALGRFKTWFSGRVL